MLLHLVPLALSCIQYLYMIKNIAVVGAGTMGNGIAHVFAQYGYKVTLIDVSEIALEKALTTIKKILKGRFRNS